uniref:Uncharacterized protein n=1 Tax=Oryza rufipogon TaxID=4529 RepID=A0A0E0R099_ORYRU
MYQAILVRYQMIPTRYQELGFEASSPVAASSPVHAPHRTRTSSPTAASSPVPSPRRSSLPATASSIGSSSPVAASSTPELITGAATITTQDPPPSMPHAGACRRRRLYHHVGSSAVHVTIPHAVACRRPRPLCRSSSPASASSTPELNGGGHVCAANVNLVCAAPTVARSPL